MTEQPTFCGVPVRWVQSFEAYDLYKPTWWTTFKVRHIPFKLRYFVHWVWYGPSGVFYSLNEWGRWNGPPPCRIARLWRRP